MTALRRTEVAVVGGGPAGAALAIALARSGREVTVFERQPVPAWRACGVYSAALDPRRLAELGMDRDEMAGLARPISAMVVHVRGGASFRLEYPAPGNAWGFARPALDRALLEHAARAGADVRRGASVRSIELETGREPRLDVAQAGERAAWSAGLLVGADGPRSLVARAARVQLGSLVLRRAGVTVHRADPAAAPAQSPDEAHLHLGDGWYCGVAPVPDGRVNVGIVMTEQRLRGVLRGSRRARAGPARLEDVIGHVSARLRPRRAWQDAPATDAPRAALPLHHRVSRAAGERFLLVGDATGFTDPLSGEGLHRAFVTAALAAAAIDRWARGDTGAAADYDRRLRARFRTKDALSLLLQAFIAEPAVAAYASARLAGRPGLRETLGRALADAVPASRVLDPRFIGRLLAP